MANYANLDYITGRLQQRLEAGESTDDGRIDFDLLKDAVHSARGAFMQQKFAKMPFIPKPYFQELCCLKLQCRDVACEGFKSGVKEHYVDIPDVMGNFGSRAFGFVGTADKRAAFKYVPTITAATGRAFPYSGSMPKLYALVGTNKLVFKNLPVTGMDYVCVEAVYSNPEDPLILECADGPYPIGGGDVQFVEDLAYERYREMAGMQPDRSNDATSNN